MSSGVTSPAAAEGPLASRVDLTESAGAGAPPSRRRSKAGGRNEGWPFYIITFVLAIALALVVAVAAAAAGLWGGLLPADLAQRMRGADHPASFLLANGAMFAAFLASFAVVIRWIHGRGFGDVVGAWRWRLFGAGAALWLAALGVLSLLDMALAPTGFRVTASPQTATLAAASLAGLGVQTFAEEFVFRGYLTPGLLKATGRPWTAAVLSGLAFGAFHIPNGWPQAANAVVFGIVLALIAIRTGGIAFGYGLHLVNNLFGAVVVVSSQDVFKGAPALVTQNTPQLMWWDVAAAATALVALAVVVLRTTWLGTCSAGQGASRDFRSGTDGPRAENGQGRGLEP